MKDEVEFSYFLDAWLYCVEHMLDWQEHIQKKNFRTWVVIV